MKIKNLSNLLSFCFISFFFALFFSKLPGLVFSVADHVVISEVQVGGGTSLDEFVELYNPTNAPIDLTGWKIMKRTAAGTENSLVVTLPSASIPANGYLLIAHTSYDGLVSADVSYSEDSTVSANNTVYLFDSVDSLIDKVGMGTAGDVEGTDTASSPANDRSIERKANSLSTKASMEAGGADEFLGNGEDTDDNDLDFILRTTQFRILKGGKNKNEDPESYIRFGNALNIIKKNSNLKSFMKLCKNHKNGPSKFSICRHGKRKEYKTQASVIMTANKEIKAYYIINNYPCRKKYKEVKLC